MHLGRRLLTHFLLPLVALSIFAASAAAHVVLMESTPALKSVVAGHITRGEIPFTLKQS